MAGGRRWLRRQAAAGVAVSLALSWVAPVLACGPSPPPLFVVEGYSPVGESVPLNAPILLKLGAIPNNDPSGESSSSPALTLVRADSEESVLVESHDSQGELAFVPSQQLEPNTTYRVHFSTGQTQPPLQNATGTADWEFTTGDSLEPPLTLSSALSVTLEPGTDPVLDCSSSCGCVETAQRIEVTKARITLPFAAGGFAARYAEIWLTDDRPYAFTTEMKGGVPFEPRVQVSDLASLEGDTLPDVLLTVPAEDFSYQPCVALAAYDARGDVAYAEPVCLEAQPPVTGQSESPTSRSRTSSACSFGPSSRAQEAWLLVVAVLSAALWRRCRLARPRVLA